MVKFLKCLVQATTLLLAMAFFAACDMPDLAGQPHLPDKQLIENFRIHRAEFEKLVAMIVEDKGLTRVDDNWTEPASYDAARVAEYRKLFKIVGTQRGVSATVDREAIEFIASSQGFVTHGSAKGYLYAKKCPFQLGKTVESLDEMSSGERPTGSGCHHIEGQWYLYFQGD